MCYVHTHQTPNLRGAKKHANRYASTKLPICPSTYQLFKHLHRNQRQTHWSFLLSQANPGPGELPAGLEDELILPSTTGQGPSALKRSVKPKFRPDLFTVYLKFKISGYVWIHSHPRLLFDE